MRVGVLLTPRAYCANDVQKMLEIFSNLRVLAYNFEMMKKYCSIMYVGRYLRYWLHVHI